MSQGHLEIQSEDPKVLTVRQGIQKSGILRINICKMIRGGPHSAKSQRKKRKSGK
jgi:hypothetical protein